MTPLCWRLLTTLPVATLAQAAEAARLYRLRWRIEQLFRTFKSDGLDFEATQVTDARRLFKRAALGLVAAVAAISAGLEGKTGRQKNHHLAGSLAWLSWVVARLGGWNCYDKPHGPTTMADGWRRLAERLEGYALAIATKHV